MGKFQTVGKAVLYKFIFYFDWSTYLKEYKK